MDNITTDLDAEERFLSEVERVVLACVNVMRIGESEHPFDSSLFRQMRDDSLRMWLIQTIESASNLSPEERAGL